MSYPPVPIPGTQLRELHSTNTDRDYEIFVSVPENHGKSGVKYPALYLLDGQWDFKLLDSVYGGLRYDRFVPEMIIIGISNGGSNPDHGSLRAMDYTPVCPEGQEGFGGGAKFLRFLADELIPFVESEYSADPTDRAIGGSSFGGLFTFYALFQAPELFRRHISISPAVSFADGVTMRYEQEYAASHGSLDARVYVAVGGLETRRFTIDPAKRLFDQISSRGYEGLQISWNVIDGERHSGVKSEAYTRGLREVFRRPVVTLPDDLLDALVGRYRFEPWDTELIISRDGDRLVAASAFDPDDTDVVLPLSETELAFRAAPILAHFSRSSDGQIDSLRVSTPDGEFTLPRI
jgi:predicted alpha/beta superfamily hydrolase